MSSLTFQNLARTRLEPGITEYFKSQQLGTGIYSYLKIFAPGRSIYIEAVSVDVVFRNLTKVTPLHGDPSKGRRAVVERISLLPEKINIRGTLIAGKGEEPRRLRQTLADLFQRGISLDVECPRLLEYDIYTISAEELAMPSGPHYNLQQFQLLATAERSVQLEILEENANA